MTLALGIGATTAMSSVVNSVIINPLPYPDSDALVSIVHTVDGRDEAYFSDAVYLHYLEHGRTFQDVGAWNPYAAAATVTGHGDPEEVRALVASRGLLTTLGVRPQLGRAFSTVDGTPGTPETVILTFDYWQRRFRGDPAIVGRALTINSRPHQVIGVMPPEFRFGGNVVNVTLTTWSADMILPLRINSAQPNSAFRLLGVARLKPGVTLAQANAEVDRILAIWKASWASTPSPFSNTRYGSSLRPLKQDVVAGVGRALWMVMGTIAIVLLMACLNVATLLLVRADARKQELAIRAALGARWIRVGRVLAVESLALALLGGILGVGLAYAGLRVLVAAGSSSVPRLPEVSMGPEGLGFAVVTSLMSGLLLGLIPILRYAGPRLATAMAAGGRGANSTPQRHRVQHALVVAQMALALMLLVSAGLMIRSVQALRGVEPGFTEPYRVQTFSIAIPASQVGDPERVTRMQQQMADNISAIAGVQSAAFTTRLPMDTAPRTSAGVTVEGRAEGGGTPLSRQTRFISPGMFRTLGTPIIAGHDFTWTDISGKRELAIVTETLARELWGSPAVALGKRIRQGNSGAWLEIVGVSADIYDEGADQRPTATVFLPARLHTQALGLGSYLPRRVSFVVRSERTDRDRLLAQMHEAVWAVDANLPLAQVGTLGDLYDQSMARTSFTLTMLAIAGVMALLLGICGLYGAVAYAVAQRRREIGIRLALGAHPRAIQALFVRRGLVLAGLGVAIGVCGAVVSTRVMESLLFGISPLDPMTFAATPVVLTAAALLASYLPARRALAVDPVETIRAE